MLRPHSQIVSAERGPGMNTEIMKRQQQPSVSEVRQEQRTGSQISSNFRVPAYCIIVASSGSELAGECMCGCVWCLNYHGRVAK